jgi:hypothetical protein
LLIITVGGLPLANAMPRGYIMIEVKWRVPLERLGFVHSLVQLENGWIVNLRPDGTLRGKRRIIGWKWWRE